MVFFLIASLLKKISPASSSQALNSELHSTKGKLARLHAEASMEDSDSETVL